MPLFRYYYFMITSDIIPDRSSDPLVGDITSEATIFGLPIWACFVLIFVLLIFSALFSASENAYSNCNKYHFKIKADEGKLTARIIVKLIDKFEDTLVAVLVGNNIVQTIMTSFSALLFYMYLEGTALEPYEAIFSTVIMGFLISILGDTIPKILSKSFPNRFAILLAWPAYLTFIILLPIILPFKLFLKLTHKIMKIKDKTELTNEDFLDQVEEAVTDENYDSKLEELFEENEKKLINRVISFDRIKVSQVLTPVEKIITMDLSDFSIDKINSFLLSHDYSRYPVIDEDKNIIGILSINAYFQEYAKDNHLDVRSCLSLPIYVKDSDTVDDIFKELNKEKVHMALVKDSKEDIIGMVTMEDILDELIGEEKNAIEKLEEAHG